MDSTHFLDIPPSVIVKFFSYLPFDEIAKSREVCRSFDEIILRDMVLDEVCLNWENPALERFYKKFQNLGRVQRLTIGYFPEEEGFLDNFHNLRSLHLCLKMNSPDFSPVLSHFSHWTGLQSLSMNYMSSRHLKEEVLPHLAQLRSLAMSSFCYLDKALLEPIFDQLKNLDSLEVAFRSFTDEVSDMFVKYGHNLTRLKLSSGDSTSVEVSPMLGSGMYKLKDFSWDNLRQAPIGRGLCSMLAHSPSLTNLTINGLSPQNAALIFGQCFPNLQKMDIMPGCDFSGMLEKICGACPSLQKLRISRADDSISTATLAKMCALPISQSLKSLKLDMPSEDCDPDELVRFLSGMKSLSSFYFLFPNEWDSEMLATFDMEQLCSKLQVCPGAKIRIPPHGHALECFAFLVKLFSHTPVKLDCCLRSSTNLLDVVNIARDSSCHPDFVLDLGFRDPDYADSEGDGNGHSNPLHDLSYDPNHTMNAHFTADLPTLLLLAAKCPKWNITADHEAFNPDPECIPYLHFDKTIGGAMVVVLSVDPSISLLSAICASHCGTVELWETYFAYCMGKIDCLLAMVAEGLSEESKGNLGRTAAVWLRGSNAESVKMLCKSFQKYRAKHKTHKQ